MFNSKKYYIITYPQQLLISKWISLFSVHSSNSRTSLGTYCLYSVCSSQCRIHWYFIRNAHSAYKLRNLYYICHDTLVYFKRRLFVCQCSHLLIWLYHSINQKSSHQSFRWLMTWLIVLYKTIVFETFWNCIINPLQNFEICIKTHLKINISKIYILYTHNIINFQ